MTNCRRVRYLFSFYHLCSWCTGIATPASRCFFVVVNVWLLCCWVGIVITAPGQNRPHVCSLQIAGSEYPLPSLLLDLLRYQDNPELTSSALSLLMKYYSRMRIVLGGLQGVHLLTTDDAVKVYNACRPSSCPPVREHC